MELEVDLDFGDDGLQPCIEFAPAKSCVTVPLPFGGTAFPDAGVICGFMYLGTATWKLRPAIGMATSW